MSASPYRRAIKRLNTLDEISAFTSKYQLILDSYRANELIDDLHFSFDCGPDDNGDLICQVLASCRVDGRKRVQACCSGPYELGVDAVHEKARKILGDKVRNICCKHRGTYFKDFCRYRIETGNITGLITDQFGESPSLEFDTKDGHYQFVVAAPAAAIAESEVLLYSQANIILSGRTAEQKATRLADLAGGKVLERSIIKSSNFFCAKGVYNGKVYYFEAMTEEDAYHGLLKQIFGPKERSRFDAIGIRFWCKFIVR